MDSTGLHTIISSVKYTALDKCLDSHSHPCFWYYGTLQKLKALPLPIFMLYRGLCYQGFNLLVLISTPALFAYTLQVSLLAGDLFDFLYSYLASTSKIKWKDKERGSSRHWTTWITVNWNAKYMLWFCKTPGSKLNLQREMKFWIVCFFTLHAIKLFWCK